MTVARYLTQASLKHCSRVSIELSEACKPAHFDAGMMSDKLLQKHMLKSNR